MSDPRTTVAPARYRKLPVAIEAMRYDGTAATCLPIHAWIGLDHEGTESECDTGLGIDTLEGLMHVSVGDWVIRGVQGEFYPCKPGIFAATYEPAGGDRTSSDPTRRTKRRWAHELYPHAAEGETRPLAVEVPYLYARFVGLELLDTGWSDAEPREMSQRVTQLIAAAHLALLADALAQGMTGDAAWSWADRHVTDDMECVYDRVVHHGVPVRDIRPYPCGPTPDTHYHYGPPDSRGSRIATLAPGPEDDCPDCTEPDQSAPTQAAHEPAGGGGR